MLFKRLDRFIHWQEEEGEMLIAQVPWCAQPGRTCSALMFSLFWDGILQNIKNVKFSWEVLTSSDCGSFRVYVAV